MTDDKKTEREAVDQRELLEMLADWRAIKQAFKDGFMGKPLNERGEHRKDTDNG